MKRKILIAVLVAAIVGILVTVLVLVQRAQPSADIMTGSSLIANIIRDVAGDKMETRTLIPPGTCPGHYDVKTSDIEALANSKALFIHNFQQNYENVTGAIEAANNPDLVITVLNATERAQAILAKGEEVENRLLDAGVEQVKVICAEMQAGFVSWAGFNITATFGRPEDLSPADVNQLVTEAKQAGVALVIDNLQSGTATLGAAIEQDIEAITVTISNFPGGLENTETWEKAIDKNVDLLLEALHEWEEQYG
jgi:zinc transport system substrate-binding protein